MEDRKYLEQARAVFDTFCKTLDKNEWKYQKDPEKLMIGCVVRGEDLPMEITFCADAKRALLSVFSHMPFVVPEDKRLDIAVVISTINNVLVDGFFDFDITGGHIFFRMSNSFVDNTISEEVMMYMLYCAAKTIDEHNDKFLMMSKGLLSVEQFLESFNVD